MTPDEAELLKLVQENLKRCEKYLDDHSPKRDEAYEVIDMAKAAFQSVERKLTMRKRPGTLGVRGY